jgi:hypothetical protein
MNQNATGHAEQKLSEFPSWPPFRNVNVQDLVALEEIELYANVIIAARESREPFTRGELDYILGVISERPPTPKPRLKQEPFSAAQVYRAARDESERQPPDFDIQEGVARFSSWLSQQDTNSRTESAD